MKHFTISLITILFLALGSNSSYGQCNITLPPLNPGICLVTVDSLNHNVVVWEKQENQPISHFTIYKEIDTTTQAMVKIGTVHYDSLSIFIDTLSDASKGSSFYRISVTDTCQKESLKSERHKTLFIQPQPGALPGYVKCQWENYLGFSFLTFYVYRGFSKDSMSLIATKAAGSFAWNDTNKTEITKHDTAYYYVEIAHPNVQGCNPTRLGQNYNSSKSNSAGIAVNKLSGVRVKDGNNVRVYPNPTNGKIRVESALPGKTDIIVTDITGRILLSKQYDGTTIDMDLSEHHSGVYFIKLSQNGVDIVKKLILD